jgi:hypothetical protein
MGKQSFAKLKLNQHPRNSTMTGTKSHRAAKESQMRRSMWHAVRGYGACQPSGTARHSIRSFRRRARRARRAQPLGRCGSSSIVVAESLTNPRPPNDLKMAEVVRLERFSRHQSCDTRIVCSYKTVWQIPYLQGGGSALKYVHRTLTNVYTVRRLCMGRRSVHCVFGPVYTITHRIHRATMNPSS